MKIKKKFYYYNIFKAIGKILHKNSTFAFEQQQQKHFLNDP